MLTNLSASKGVDLQIAGAVFFYDYPFTYGDMNQLFGRISRVGSKFNSLLVHMYLSESELAIENCMYKSIIMQMNFASKVDNHLVDFDLLDSDIVGDLDPEDADKYLMSSLGFSKSYYYSI